MPNKLSQKLRSLRQQKKLSLDKLAEQTGMSKSYLWELENRDRSSPSAEKLSKLADCLGVTSDYLLDEKVSEPDESIVREAFFRKYDRLDPNAKQMIGDILEKWSQRSNDSS